MATIKVACPKCGQKVSGDESFFGSTVECPVCSSDIRFPGEPREDHRSRPAIQPVPPEGGNSPTPSRSLGSVEENLSNPGAQSEATEVVPTSPSSQGAPQALPTESKDDEVAFTPSPIYGSIAIVSAVLSIVTCVGGILFAPLAIIFGHTALAKARNSPVQPAPGQTLGAIGLMIGYVSLVFLILLLLVLSFFGDTIREAIGQRAE